jgi:hypothetical protein
MPNGQGASDLYFSVKDKDKRWRQPINLQSLNSPGVEMSPRFYKNRLLFSSEGHNSMGKLDIFLAKKPFSKAPQIERLDALNSKADDFGFIINETNDLGFFASNRNGGKGDDDIYSVEIKEVQVALSVKSLFNNQPIKAFDVEITGEKGKKAKRISSDANGKVFMTIPPDLAQKLTINANNHYKKEIDFKIEQAEFGKEYYSVINLEPQFIVAGTVLDRDSKEILTESKVSLIAYFVKSCW